MNLNWRLVKALNHLAVFEIAVEQGSFTKAAEVLGTTQPSISRHIGALENMLEVQLFTRSHRKVELTEAGAELFDAAKLGLDHIRGAIERVALRQRPATVTVGCTYGFAHLWLMPRFSALQGLISGHELRMVTSDTSTLFDLHEVDFALRFGRGNWGDGDAQKLFGERLFPVCSPEFAKRHFGGVVGVQARDIAEAPLIHEREQGNRWLSWEQWFGQHEVSYQAPDNAYYYDNYALTLQAAMDGRGVALAWLHLAEPPLVSGQLVELEGLKVATDSGYYLAYRHGHPKADRIVAWFKQMAKEQEHDIPAALARRG